MARKLPLGISVGDEVYKIVVALVNTKDAKGRPKLVTFLHDDQEIELAGGEEFITTYVPKKMVNK